MYAHQWTGPWEADLASLLQAGLLSELAPTASEEERFLGGVAQMSHAAAGSAKRLVAICAFYAATGQWLADACAAHGYRPLIVRPAIGAETEFAGAQIRCAAWCGDVNLPSQARQFAEFATAARPAQAVALLHFPRPEDIARARELGACGVLSLPLNIEQLMYWIRSTIDANEHRG
jgi:hypothetical protein